MNYSDITERETELIDLFKSQDFVVAANRLFDFATDFPTTRECRRDCIVYCNRAANIIVLDKKRKFRSPQDFLDVVQELIVEMLEQFDFVMDELSNAERVA